MQPLRRRGLLGLITRIGSLAFVAPLASLVPESRVAPANSRVAGGSAVDLNDPEVQQVLSSIRASKEWKQYSHALANPNPDWFQRPEHGGYAVAFSLFDMSPTAVGERKVGPFQLLQVLAFGVDPDMRVTAVVHGEPSPDGSRILKRDLRTGDEQLVDMAPPAIDEIAQARARARSAKQQIVSKTAGSSGGKLAAPLADICDCGPGYRYYCASYIVVPGHVDQACATGCFLSCFFFTRDSAYCSAACNVACFVLGYTTCGSYYCNVCDF